MRVILSLFIIFSMISCSVKEKVDLLFINATIYSVDSLFQKASSLAIKGSKIVSVGSEDSLKKIFRASEIIDLKGAFVYPGFIDAHCHFTGYGLNQSQCDLRGTQSRQEVLEKLKAHYQKFPESWLLGRGWDQNDWPVKEFPDHAYLDSIFPNVPVYLTRVDGHAAWVNKKALDMAGIDASTKVEGGEILIKDKHVQGILIDNAMDLVFRIIPRETPEQIKQALLLAQKNCLAVGLTSVGDAGLDKSTVEIIDQMQKEGILKIRINAMLNPTQENFSRYIEKGSYITERLSVRSIKLFADGALGSRGALLSQPYSDAPATRGILIQPLDYYRNICAQAIQYGYQVCTHCIGDEANKIILDVYAEFLKKKNDLRWRIEHAQVVDPADLPKFGHYSIIPSVQTTHATSDMYWAGERLGERILNAYTYRSLLEQNGWLPNGSDFPVEYIHPLYGFYAAVSRKDQKGYPAGGFQMQEALSREQALRAMTLWAARAAFEEVQKGSLETGKEADFVVLDTDLMKAPEEKLFSAKVFQTWIGGEKVYPN